MQTLPLPTDIIAQGAAESGAPVLGPDASPVGCHSLPVQGPRVPRASGDRRRSRGTPPAVEARTGERRQASVERRVVDLGSPTGLERRRGPGRRLSDDRRAAEEGHLTDEQFAFVLAIDTYKRVNAKPYPSWTEILEVIKQMGYRKVEASTLALPTAEAPAPAPAPASAAAPAEPLPPASVTTEPAPDVSEIFQG